MKPSTGVPLFLGTVVVMVFAVHYAILSHTTWFASYWQGGAKAPVTASAPAIETAPAAATPTSAAPATPAP
ncbi:MAG: light-harvesting protein [Gemmatimonadaceae bacterium]|nr:light-harvesting protein [Gemmatimonadaceae bacterium]